MKRLAFGVLLVAATLGLNTTAAELSAKGTDKTCKRYFRGQIQIQGNIARKEATKLAEEFAENNLKRDCHQKNGILSHGIQIHTGCGAFEESGSFRLFEGTVCVTCEATATGDCQ